MQSGFKEYILWLKEKMANRTKNKQKFFNIKIIKLNIISLN